MRASRVLYRDVSQIDGVLAAVAGSLEHEQQRCAGPRNPEQNPRRDRPGDTSDDDDGDGAIAPRQGGTEPPEDPSGPPDDPPDPDPDVK